MSDITMSDLLYLLRRAGETMRRMPGGGLALALSRVSLGDVDDPRLAYGYSPVQLNKIPPSAADISLMDLVHPWLSFIPDSSMHVRRVVVYRILWDSDRARSIWPVRRLADKFGKTRQTIWVWEKIGYEMILEKVCKNSELKQKIALYLVGANGAYVGYVETRASARFSQSQSSSNFVSS